MQSAGSDRSIARQAARRSINTNLDTPLAKPSIKPRILDQFSIQAVAAYRQLHTDIQPALNGRSIHWQQHALVGTRGLDSLDRLKAKIKSPAIEVALTKVIEGRVSGHYDVFNSTIGSILDGEDGCDGWRVGPQIENPQPQILLENSKSVDVSAPTPSCIEAIIEVISAVISLKL